MSPQDLLNHLRDHGGHWADLLTTPLTDEDVERYCNHILDGEWEPPDEVYFLLTRVLRDAVRIKGMEQELFLDWLCKDCGNRNPGEFEEVVHDNPISGKDYDSRCRRCGSTATGDTDDIIAEMISELEDA
jgi:ribosomal protein L40E